MNRSVTIEICGLGAEGPFARDLANVPRQIVGVSGEKVLWAESDEWIYPGKPSLTIASGTNHNIHYLAVPEGHQFDPLMDAISRLGQRDASPFQGSTNPVHVVIFVAPSCPHCPHAVRSALSLAVGDGSVTVSVVDALQFPDLAGRYKVRSTPTTIVNDTLTLVGEVSGSDLAAHVEVLRESGATTTVIASMIESGRAEDAADLVCSGKIARALLPLYVSPEFSRRMGAMVVMEASLERDPRCLDLIVDDLITVLSHEDVGLRGDTAGLLGQIGSPKAVPALQKALHDPDADVQEAAQEALTLIEG